jgi:hypothetical protein
MAIKTRFRDTLKKDLPWWLSDRHLSSGKSAGYRFLYILVAMLDIIAEWIVQGLQAPWPGIGTPSALPYIGRSRGFVRGVSDTDASFSARLLAWLDKWSNAGTQRQLAIELHEYLGGNPRVRIVNRAGSWVTVAADGTIATNTGVSLNWDSISNPERSGYWSDMWIIVYPTPWVVRPLTIGDLTGDDGYGLGHMAPRSQIDATKGLLAQWKSAHTRIRAVIWTSDSTLFDPATPASLPDGTWGQWSQIIGGVSQPSNRNTTTCRYWEPWR